MSSAHGEAPSSDTTGRPVHTDSRPGSAVDIGSAADAGLAVDSEWAVDIGSGVDVAAELDALRSRPLAEHPDVFARVHEHLHRDLSSVDDA